ncbi:MAG: deoxyribodipyrimidine photolyase, partial [Gammaproteobacteria bacterium CG_4_9_14_3_um_filter_38_9]
MKKNIIIHWFRYDLRLSDNPALKAAIDKGTVLPIYIKDTHNADDYAMGSASKWWLHHGLKSLEQSLEGNLSFYSGDPMAILKKIAEHF